MADHFILNKSQVFPVKLGVVTVKSNQQEKAASLFTRSFEVIYIKEVTFSQIPKVVDLSSKTFSSSAFIRELLGITYIIFSQRVLNLSRLFNTKKNHKSFCVTRISPPLLKTKKKLHMDP